MCLCFWSSRQYRASSVGGESYRLGFPHTKKTVNLARERMILDLSTWFLVWLLAHPASTRRVAVAAPLLQACSSPTFTLARHTCRSSLALTCPGLDSLIYHSTATRQCACLLYVFGARPLTAFVCAGRSSWKIKQLTRTSAR